MPDETKASTQPAVVGAEHAKWDTEPAWNQQFTIPVADPQERFVQLSHEHFASSGFAPDEPWFYVSPADGIMSDGEEVVLVGDASSDRVAVLVSMQIANVSAASSALVSILAAPNLIRWRTLLIPGAAIALDLSAVDGVSSLPGRGILLQVEPLGATRTRIYANAQGFTRAA